MNIKTLFFATIAMFLTLFFAFVAPGHAAHDAKIEAEWAWSGTDQTTQGFRFYLDGKVVQEIASATDRISSWTLPLENGKHIFTLTAYGPDWESEHSPEYVFEYLHVDSNGRPPPTVFIRIN